MLGEFMNINLRKVETKDDIDLFANYKLDLIKSHEYYAEKLELVDKKVNSYSKEDAIRNIGKEDFYQFIINYNNIDVGFIEYDIEISDIDSKEIVYIKNMFINNDYRHVGIGTEVLNNLKENTKSRIELECWYDMPANELYKKLGMKQIKTRYVWKQMIK